MNERIINGSIVRHFKYETSDNEDSVKGVPHLYCYEVIETNAISANDGRRLVIYKPLYSPNIIYVRDWDEFISEVDHEKYPDIKQKYRFEVVHVTRYFTDKW